MEHIVFWFTVDKWVCLFTCHISR